MTRLIIEPNGWPCSLAECPPGHFVYGKELCFKTEYKTADGKIEAYCESGEFFVAGAQNEEGRRQLIVQPVSAVWESEE